MSIYGEKQNPYHIIGKDLKRVDALEKVLGTAKYAADLQMQGMLYGGSLRMKEFPVKILTLDASVAMAMDGVEAVITCFDQGVKKQSWADYYYLTDEVKFVGDVVAIVAARSRKILRKALDSIQVT